MSEELYNERLQPEEGLQKGPYKVVMLGAPTAGKSALIQPFTSKRFSQSYKSTISAEFTNQTFEIDDQKKIKLEIWDIPGTTMLQNKHMLPTYLENTSLAIIACPLNNASALDVAKQYINEVPQDTLMILVGTKSDIANESVLEKVKELANDKKARYIETSAKENTNVNELFQLVADTIYKRVAHVLTPEGQALWDIREQIDNELNNENPLFQTGFFGSRQMTTNNKEKIRVHANVKKIYKLCDDVLEGNTKMTAEETCKKISKIVNDKEMASNFLVKIIRNILAFLGLGPSKDQREKLDQAYGRYNQLAVNGIKQAQG